MKKLLLSFCATVLLAAMASNPIQAQSTLDSSAAFAPYGSTVTTHVYPAPAQKETCQGTIFDEDGEPLIGATVVVKGTTKAAATDAEGKFSLPDVPLGATLDISYVGYHPQSILFDGSPINVQLKSAANQLDEMVVVAYGAQKKSSITGSISSVNSDEIELRPVSSVASALEGATSGVTVTGSYGSPGESPSIQIRGIGTINGTTSPLYVVDGVPYSGNISDLNPSDIESMSVLKDAASTALYGNRAANGVILISTKKGSRFGRTQFNVKISQGFYQRGIPEYASVSPWEFMDVAYQLMTNDHMISNGLSYANAADLAAARQNTLTNMMSQFTYYNPFKGDLATSYSEGGLFNRSNPLLDEVAGDLDWFGQSIHTGNRGEYQVNASGANDKSDYYFSLAYLSEEGYMRKTGMDRFSARANLNIQPTKWLKSGINLDATHQKLQNTGNGNGLAATSGSNKDVGTSSMVNPWFFCRNIAPIYPVHVHDLATGAYLYEDGKKMYNTGYNGTEQTRNQFVGRNVIWENEVNHLNTRRNTMNGVAYADFMLPYGFDIKLQGNLNTVNTEELSYSSSLVGDAVTYGRDSKYIFNYKSYTFQQQLHWNKTFNNEHSFNVLLGHENYSYMYDRTYGRKTDLAFEGNDALDNFATLTSLDGYRLRYRTESYLGRVQYNYAGKYNIEGSFRRDGSSRFAKDVRWGNFGSVGANWVFTSEDFMRRCSWLNSGKLFANWGQVANDAAADYYAYYALFSDTTNASLPGYFLSQLAATNLQWETMESWGVGLDLRMFNRWNLSVEYYNKTNKDLIFELSAPASAGATGTKTTGAITQVNLGSISNTGFEISTDIDIYRTNDWKINLGASMSTLRNRVTSLPEEYCKTMQGDHDAYFDYQGNLLYANGTKHKGVFDPDASYFFLSEDHSRYDFYTYHYCGVDQMTGYALYTPNLTDYYIDLGNGEYLGGIYYKDASSNMVLDKGKCNELTPENYVLIDGQYYVNYSTYAARDFVADALPKVYGSFNASLTWKSLHLNALFTYSLGGRIYDYAYATLMSPSSTPNNYSTDILNSWTGIPSGMTESSPGRISNDIYPMVTSSASAVNKTLYGMSDRWLVSRNYLCFKNLNIGWDLPKTFLNQLGVQGAQLGFSAENLFIRSARKGMNPMLSITGSTNNVFAPARVYTFSLSVNL